MLTRKLWKGLKLVIVISLIIIVGGITGKESIAAAEPPTVPDFDDPAELETFLDSVIMAQLNDLHIAGATVAVVKDGEVFFTKGYGYADVEKQAPVNPESTVYFVGSIAKLFTWTAVMQLFERGQLDLDADINQYLDFRIPATFPEPITLKHLMTHTAGFEETPFGFVTDNPETMVPYGEWLVNNIPARKWPPGQIPMYSNYGTGLAGYIVERVSGVPYETYIEQHIMVPLGMSHSTVHQPVPQELADDQAQGYSYVNNSFQQQSDLYPIIVPAGGLRATATDIARFMIAHLQDGRYCEQGCAGGETRILSESTAQLMHSHLWAAGEHINGFAYGFYELSQNGQRVIAHGGSADSFHSLLALLPGQNSGLFVSYNSPSSRGVPEELLKTFMDHYFPVLPAEPSIPPTGSAVRTDRLIGSYQMNRLEYSGGGKIKGIISYSVESNSEGELIFLSRRFTGASPLLFEEVGGDGRLLFRENNDGDIVYMFINDSPMMALRKVAWYETTNFNFGLLAVSALLFVSVLVVGLVRLFTGLVRRRSQPPQHGLSRLALLALVAMAIVGLILEIGLYFVITDTLAAVSGQRGLFTVLGGISILALLIAVSIFVFTVLAWRERWWRMSTRIHYTLVTVASMALIWFLTFWNQLGWQWW